MNGDFPTSTTGPGAGLPKKKEPKVEPPRVMECADCHKSFANRSITEWDVHLPDGTYITVCTPCFEKRDQARPGDDAPEKPPKAPAKAKPKAPAKKKK